MTWLEILNEWYGTPAVNQNEELKFRGDGNEDILVRVWAWFPKNAYTNHNIRIERSLRWENFDARTTHTKWVIKITRHTLLGKFKTSRVVFDFINDGEQPSDELMLNLIDLVGFVDYGRELD